MVALNVLFFIDYNAWENVSLKVGKSECIFLACQTTISQLSCVKLNAISIQVFIECLSSVSNAELFSSHFL